MRLPYGRLDIVAPRDAAVGWAGDELSLTSAITFPAFRLPVVPVWKTRTTPFAVDVLVRLDATEAGGAAAVG